MKFTTKAQRRELDKKLQQRAVRELKYNAKYVAKEYGKIGSGVLSELGNFFTGAPLSKPNKR